jgi:hypothetical protein
VIAVDLGGYVEGDELSLLENPEAWDSVDHLIVNAHADRPGITVGQNGARPSAHLTEQSSSGVSTDIGEP